MMKSVPYIHLKRSINIWNRTVFFWNVTCFIYYGNNKTHSTFRICCIGIININHLINIMHIVQSHFKDSHILSQQTLKSGKSVKLSRAEVLQKIGELFALRWEVTCRITKPGYQIFKVNSCFNHVILQALH